MSTVDVNRVFDVCDSPLLGRGFYGVLQNEGHRLWEGARIHLHLLFERRGLSLLFSLQALIGFETSA
jgi:UTP:GlnB (protein PII) uridylyltransferase